MLTITGPIKLIPQLDTNHTGPLSSTLPVALVQLQLGVRPVVLGLGLTLAQAMVQCLASPAIQVVVVTLVLALQLQVQQVQVVITGRFTIQATPMGKMALMAIHIT